MADERLQLEPRQQVAGKRQPTPARPARLERGVDRRHLRADDSQPPAVEWSTQAERHRFRAVPRADDHGSAESHASQGLIQRADVATGFDRHVKVSAVERFPRSKYLVCAQAACELASARNRVDRDEVRRAGAPRQLRNQQPDRALTEYCHAFAEPWPFARIEYLGGIGNIRRRLADGGGRVAVLPKYFIREELRAGRLVTLMPRVKPRPDSFRLVWRAGHPREAELMALAADLRRHPLR